MVEHLLLTMTNAWFHQVCGKCYIYQYLYLPQVAPLAVKWVTSGSKVYGTNIMMQAHLWYLSNDMTHIVSPNPANSVSQVQWATWWCYIVYLRSGVFDKTSFHMWGNWYFPMFVLKDRSLTFMNVASLMVLARACDSLPRMEKSSNLVWWPEVLAWS